MSTPGRLLLVPLPLGDMGTGLALPPATLEQVRPLRRFIAEDARTARRFLAQLPLAHPIQEVVFDTLNEHTQAHEIDRLVAPLLAGEDVGLVSEAGCPGVADPGAAVIARAHDVGIPVVPLIGPSAILLALMASGLSGQRFRFSGYLPVDANERITAIKALEATSAQSDETQVFIETPYRNDAMLAALIETCAPRTRLAIGTDLTLPSEEIISATIERWRSRARPQLAKRPTVFLLQAQSAISATARRRSRSS